MKKTFLSLVLLFSFFATTHANSLILANLTCSPFTLFFLNNTNAFMGQITIPKSTTLTFTDPADFISYPGVINLQPSTPLSVLAQLDFEALRGWEVSPQENAFSLGINNTTASGWVLSCSGVIFNAIWLPNGAGGVTVIII